MDAEWLYEAVGMIAAICAVIAVVECAAEECASDSGLRLVCGAVAVSSVLNLLTGCLQRLF